MEREKTGRIQPQEFEAFAADYYRAREKCALTETPAEQCATSEAEGAEECVSIDLANTEVNGSDKFGSDAERHLAAAENILYLYRAALHRHLPDAQRAALADSAECASQVVVLLCRIKEEAGVAFYCKEAAEQGGIRADTSTLLNLIVHRLEEFAEEILRAAQTCENGHRKQNLLICFTLCMRQRTRLAPICTLKRRIEGGCI